MVARALEAGTKAALRADYSIVAGKHTLPR